MAQEQEATPSFTIEKLYVKDLSLEVPNAPEIFLDQESPEISVQLQTGIQPLNDEAFEVDVLEKVRGGLVAQVEGIRAFGFYNGTVAGVVLLALVGWHPHPNHKIKPVV